MYRVTLLLCKNNLGLIDGVFVGIIFFHKLFCTTVAHSLVLKNYLINKRQALPECQIESTGNLNQNGIIVKFWCPEQLCCLIIEIHHSVCGVLVSEKSHLYSSNILMMKISC